MNKLPNKFDYIFYSNYYTDLKNAFGFDKLSLENHYLTHGRFENRKYCDFPEKFNWKTYLQLNDDKFTSMESRTKNNVIEHFLNNDITNTEEYIDNEISSVNEKPIFILYYAFLNNNKDWRSIIKGQIFDVIKSGIINVSKFHAVLLGTPENIQEAKLILETILNITIEITEVFDNQYEFPAIIKIRELALIHPEKIFIYIHSKGMVNHNPGTGRTNFEQRLTLNTFLDWETTLHIFEKYPLIQKAALFPGNTGLGWFNFWWARGSHLISCKPIKIPENMVENDRFKCEDWLGSHGSQTWEDCYSIVNKNISFSSNPSEDLWRQI
jgi:hypothetical protein